MQNLYSGLFLMIVGMGTVFLFLVLLILATESVRRLIGGDTPVPASAASAPPPPKAPPASHDDATLAAVIASAVTQFRRDREDG